MILINRIMHQKCKTNEQTERRWNNNRQNPKNPTLNG